MRYSLPASVRIACFDVQIRPYEKNHACAAGKFGEWSSIELVLRVDPEVPAMKVIDSLLHEITHGIFWAYGIEEGDKEERVVGVLGTAWTQIFRDNRHILQWIESMTIAAEGEKA